MAAPLPTADPGVLVEQLLADLGGIVRAARAETLTEEAFERAARSMRSKLQALAVLHAAEPIIDVAETGRVLGQLLDAGVLTPATVVPPPFGRRRGLTLVAGTDLNPQGD